MKNKKTVNQLITERIIERIESTGALPWKRPWATSEDLPRNLISHKNYRGINAFLLHAMGYDSPCWLTMKQVNGLGGKVRKGERCCPVVFWKFMERDETKNGTNKPYALLRYYNVFNADQCDGIPETKLPVPKEPRKVSMHAVAEEILANMPHRPMIRYRGSKAFYAPAIDEVHIPKQERFESDEGYYATLFHELSHATGHQSRLARKTMTELTFPKKHEYSKEELVAEMGATFLCGHCGILPEVEDNATAYLKGWLKQLKANPSLLVQSGVQAQKVYDYILDREKTVEGAKESKQGALL